MKFNFKDNIPIYYQIIDDVKYKVISGKLNIGDKVDSVRDLAMYYGVNPNTIQKALTELEKENLMKSKGTSGRFICADEKLIASIKSNIANDLTKEYINEMKKIGYDFNQILEYIKNEEEAK